MKKITAKTPPKVKPLNNSLERLKQENLELRASKRDLTKIQVVGRIGLYVLDIKKEIWTSSPVLDKIFGITKTNKRTIQTWIDLLHPDSQKEMVNYFNKEVIGKKKRFNKKYKIIRPNDKKVIWVHGLGELDINKRGRPIKMFGTIQDITKEIEFEKLLKDSENRYRTIIERMGQGLTITKDKKVVYVNPAMEEMTGYKSKELIGTDFRKYIHPESMEKVMDMYKLRLTKKKVEKYIMAFNHKDGRKIYVETTGSTIKFKNKKARFVMLRDVTVEMEVDRMKTEFVSLASHQLRTPLTAARWHLEEMIENEEKLTSRQKKLAHEALDANKNMIRLVNDLLNVARLESGRISIDAQSYNIVELVRKVINDNKKLAKEKNCKVTLQLPKSKLPAIKIDPSLIHEVVTNLHNNAIKYTPKSKQSEDIIIKISIKKPDLEISIQDYGIGIPRKNHSHVFDKFFRADNAIPFSAEGTGLGLYIAKSVVEASGGKIWFKSPLNSKKTSKGEKIICGSIFTFSLPLKGSASHKGDRNLV